MWYNKLEYFSLRRIIKVNLKIILKKALENGEIPDNCKPNEIYNICKHLGYEYSEEKFREEFSALICEGLKKMSEKELDNVAGGKSGLISKLGAYGLSALGVLSVVSPVGAIEQAKVDSSKISKISKISQKTTTNEKSVWTSKSAWDLVKKYPKTAAFIATGITIPTLATSFYGGKKFYDWLTYNPLIAFAHDTGCNWWQRVKDKDNFVDGFKWVEDFINGDVIVGRPGAVPQTTGGEVNIRKFDDFFGVEENLQHGRMSSQKSFESLLKVLVGKKLVNELRTQLNSLASGDPSGTCMAGKVWNEIKNQLKAICEGAKKDETCVREFFEVMRVVGVQFSQEEVNKYSALSNSNDKLMKSVSTMTSEELQKLAQDADAEPRIVATGRVELAKSRLNDFTKTIAKVKERAKKAKQSVNEACNSAKIDVSLVDGAVDETPVIRLAEELEGKITGALDMIDAQERRLESAGIDILQQTQGEKNEIYKDIIQNVNELEKDESNGIAYIQNTMETLQRNIEALEAEAKAKCEAAKDKKKSRDEAKTAAVGFFVNGLTEMRHLIDENWNKPPGEEKQCVDGLEGLFVDFDELYRNFVNNGGDGSYLDSPDMANINRALEQMMGSFGSLLSGLLGGGARKFTNYYGGVEGSYEDDIKVDTIRDEDKSIAYGFMRYAHKLSMLGMFKESMLKHNPQGSRWWHHKDMLYYYDDRNYGKYISDIRSGTRNVKVPIAEGFFFRMTPDDQSISDPVTSAAFKAFGRCMSCIGKLLDENPNV